MAELADTALAVQRFARMHVVVIRYLMMMKMTTTNEKMLVGMGEIGRSGR
jgi:hypothetical protein